MKNIPSCFFSLLFIAFPAISFRTPAQDQMPDYEAYVLKLCISRPEFFAASGISSLGSTGVNNKPHKVKIGYALGVIASRLTGKFWISVSLCLKEKRWTLFANQGFVESGQTSKKIAIEMNNIYNYHALPVPITFLFGIPNSIEIQFGVYASSLKSQTLKATFLLVNKNTL